MSKWKVGYVETRTPDYLCFRFVEAESPNEAEEKVNEELMQMVGRYRVKKARPVRENRYKWINK